MKQYKISTLLKLFIFYSILLVLCLITSHQMNIDNGPGLIVFFIIIPGLLSAGFLHCAFFFAPIIRREALIIFIIGWLSALFGYIYMIKSSPDPEALMTLIGAPYFSTSVAYLSALSAIALKCLYLMIKNKHRK